MIFNGPQFRDRSLNGPRFRDWGLNGPRDWDIETETTSLPHAWIWSWGQVRPRPGLVSDGLANASVSESTISFLPRAYPWPRAGSMARAPCELRGWNNTHDPFCHVHLHSLGVTRMPRWTTCYDMLESSFIFVRGVLVDGCMVDSVLCLG